MRQRARADNLTICYRKKKKQIDVRISCIYPGIDNEFRHTIVKVQHFENLKTEFMINNNDRRIFLTKKNDRRMKNCQFVKWPMINSFKRLCQYFSYVTVF